MQVGALIEGVVRRIEPFGVFVGIKGTRVSGLLHVSNISRLHVDNPGVRSWQMFSRVFQIFRLLINLLTWCFFSFPLYLFSFWQGVFKVGEKLSAVILGIDYDYSNISLSTAELEVVDGEVLSNKDQVWANAGASLYTAL